MSIQNLQRLLSFKGTLALGLLATSLFTACGNPNLSATAPAEQATNMAAKMGGKVSQQAFPALQAQTGFGLKAVAQAPRVLLVVANRDFWYGDYAFTRQGLLDSGAQVTVAAGSTQLAYPQAEGGGTPIQPDLALSAVQAADYDAVVFLGGWGASAYQFGMTQTYAHAPYNGSSTLRSQSNALIQAFLAQNKIVAGLCHGVTALAYARVNGVSPLQGKQVVGWNGFAPQIQGQGYPTSRAQIEGNGAVMGASGAVGNPATSADDVVVDGQIITGENVDSGYRLGQVIASEVRARTVVAAPTAAPTATPLPVLMVIANRDFYYREYAVPRAELLARGLQVRVAAQTTQVSYPHPDSGQGASNGAVQPDLALSQVRSQDYSAIVFVGGWGSSAYQYAPPGLYTNALYNGTPAVKADANRLIGEFMAQDKYVTAICHGVSVLAWARVNGSSPLAGRRATGGPFLPPLVNAPNQYSASPSWYISANQGLAVPSRSLGNPATSADDVIVDGRIIVAEDYDSAELFGQTLAHHLNGAGL